MITTRSYFWGDLQIANAEDHAPNSNLLGNKTALQKYINIYERELLSKLFGATMYAEFSEQFDVNPVTLEWTIKASADQKWKDLLNGSTYDGKTWNGLIQGVEGAKTSFIANYIYCKFIEGTQNEHTGVGFTITQSKNAMRVSGRVNWANAWNGFVEKVGIDWHDYYWRNNYSLNDIALNTYLNDKATDFPDWNNTHWKFELKNRFGL